MSTISLFLAIKYTPTFAVSWTLFLTVNLFFFSAHTAEWGAEAASQPDHDRKLRTTWEGGHHNGCEQATARRRDYCSQVAAPHSLSMSQSAAAICEAVLHWVLFSVGFAWAIVALMANEIATASFWGGWTRNSKSWVMIAWSLLSPRHKVTLYIQKDEGCGFF